MSWIYLMKRVFIISLLSIPCISTANSGALDYCASVESWAAQKTIDKAITKNRGLDAQKATSILLERNELKEGNKPVTFGEWGQLYIQTIKVSIPFLDSKKPPVVILASSIISAEECSLSEPSMLEMGSF